MTQPRRKKISFTAQEKVQKPVKVEFYTKSGERVSFEGHASVNKPVKVEFYAKGENNKNKEK